MASKENQNFMLNERLLVSSGNGILSLTNMRVIYDAKTSGASKFICIPLDAVACSGLVTRSYPILLIVAAIAFLFCFVPNFKQETVIGLGIATIVLVVVYFSTRRAILTISPNGGEHISILAKGMKREEILSFLNSVLEAKHSYLQSVRGANAS
jgi:hypothetical protein